MIKGLGTDIVETELFLKEWEKNGENAVFFRYVFSDKEIKNCMKSDVPVYERLAARYAAKEAFIKALKPLLGTKEISKDSPDFLQIEVLNNEDGSPFFKIGEKYSLILKNLGITNILLSLSHESKYAVATVIME